MLPLGVRPGVGRDGRRVAAAVVVAADHDEPRDLRLRWAVRFYDGARHHPG